MEVHAVTSKNERLQAIKERKGKIKPEKKEKVKDTPMERLKALIATELGLTERVITEGWGGLSAAETGRIGGLMSKRMRDEPDILFRLWIAAPANRTREG
jgi:hypothetical protein